jgi:hypothetical protein
MPEKQTSGLRTSRMKRSVRTLLPTSLIPGTHLSPQRTSYERNRKTGSLLRIPPQIIILPARPTTREQHPGSSKVAFMNNGSRLNHLSGSMENVPSFLIRFLKLNPTDFYFCSRLWKKRPLVCHFLLMPPAFTQIISQLWYNRGHHVPTRSGIVNCGLFLL